MTEITRYKPGAEEQRTKATFWVRAKRQGVCREDVSLATALSLTADSRITNWWAQPGFSAWFANDTEFEEEMEFLIYRMPFYLQDILEAQGEEASASAKVNALKLLAEIANKMPVKHKQVVWKDASIQSMTPDQLRKFIAKESRKLGLASPLAERSLKAIVGSTPVSSGSAEEDAV